MRRSPDVESLHIRQQLPSQSREAVASWAELTRLPCGFWAAGQPFVTSVSEHQQRKSSQLSSNFSISIFQSQKVVISGVTVDMFTRSVEKMMQFWR